MWIAKWSMGHKLGATETVGSGSTSINILVPEHSALLRESMSSIAALGTAGGFRRCHLCHQWYTLTTNSFDTIFRILLLAFVGMASESGVLTPERIGTPEEISESDWISGSYASREEQRESMKREIRDKIKSLRDKLDAVECKLLAEVDRLIGRQVYADLLLKSSFLFIYKYRRLHSTEYCRSVTIATNPERGFLNRQKAHFHRQVPGF